MQDLGVMIGNNGNNTDMLSVQPSLQHPKQEIDADLSVFYSEDNSMVSPKKEEGQDTKPRNKF